MSKLNSEAKRRFGENENKVLYFADLGEKEITAVAGYKYDCFSEVHDDIIFISHTLFVINIASRFVKSNCFY